MGLTPYLHEKQLIEVMLSTDHLMAREVDSKVENYVCPRSPQSSESEDNSRKWRGQECFYFDDEAKGGEGVNLW
jgi:hypothetical protein